MTRSPNENDVTYLSEVTAADTQTGSLPIPKREYQPPVVLTIGDFKALTQAKGGKKGDGPGRPRSRLVWNG